MTGKKQLRKRQLAVIDDLFAGELDEQSVLDKHKLSRNVYNKWLVDEHFGAELARRAANAHLQSEILIARYCTVAAAKLVQLTESVKEETARKACLDIISLQVTAAKKSKQSAELQTANPDERGQVQQLPPETCSRLLAVLAEAGGKEGDVKKGGTGAGK